MENINERVRQINREEAAELKGTLDAYFEAHPMEEAFVIPSGKSTVINLGAGDGECHYTTFKVDAIKRTPEGYNLALIRCGNGCDNFGEVHEHALGDADFIPGELSNLTDVVKGLAHTKSLVCEFSDKQKLAIRKFNDAMKYLHQTSVALLVDNCDCHFRFANAKDVAYFCRPDNSDNTVKIDYELLPETSEEHDGDFFGDDEGLGVELA